MILKKNFYHTFFDIKLCMYLHEFFFQFELAERKSSPSPLAIATNGSGSQPVSPLATPIPVPNSSPSSSAWSRRPLAAQSASSAPSSLIQVCAYVLTQIEIHNA